MYHIFLRLGEKSLAKSVKVTIKYAFADLGAF